MSAPYVQLHDSGQWLAVVEDAVGVTHEAYGPDPTVALARLVESLADEVGA